MSQDDITAVLQQLGYVEEQSNGDWPQRAKIEGTTIYLGDEMYVSNPKTKTPAMRVRLLGVPEEYQGAYLDPELSALIGRPGDANKYCKSRFEVEGEARKFSDLHADCNKCPISPFTKRDNLPVLANGQTRKCAWRAEVSFQVLDADGLLSDDTIWVIDLSTTGVIEFKGTGREPVLGSASPFNFMQQLARFGAQSNPENPADGLRKALLGLRLGAIVADVRQLPMSSDDKSRSWYVTSFEPVQILDLDEVEADAGVIAIEDGLDSIADTGTTNLDDLPF
jgi:hypothetical protein